VHLSFHTSSNPGTKIPLAALVRMLTEEMTHVDKKVILFLLIDKKKTYYPSNDKFTKVKENFKEFFISYPVNHKTPTLMMVSCIIQLMKTLTNMKQGEDALTSLLP